MTVRALPWVDFGGVTVSGNDVLRQNALKLAHAYLNANVGKGDTVIDATAGKGRDTLLLASLVGENGKSHCNRHTKRSDRRSRKTHCRARGFGQSDVRLRFATKTSKSYADKVNCVVFNLGWLPGSDHE